MGEMVHNKPIEKWKNISVDIHVNWELKQIIMIVKPFRSEKGIFLRLILAD